MKREIREKIKREQTCGIKTKRQVSEKTKKGSA